MPGMNMLVDIGNGTMSILEIHDGRPIEKSISTEVFWKPLQLWENRWWFC